MRLIRPKQRPTLYIVAMAAVLVAGLGVFMSSQKSLVHGAANPEAPVVTQALAEQTKGGVVGRPTTTPAYVRSQPTQVTSSVTTNTPGPASGASRMPASTPTPPQPRLITITGLVEISPSAPVCDTTMACSTPVANHTVQMVASNGQVMQQVQTDANGDYSFMFEAIRPGTYTLVLSPDIVAPGRSQPIYSVTITPGAYDYSNDIIIDSGIR